jgi:uncharacterized BrkB/YihY/UPF0761 family membrane protein
MLKLTPAAQPPDITKKPAEFSATAPATNPTSKPAAAIVKQKQFVLFLILWQLARYGIALLLMFWIVSLIFHYGPNMKRRFRLLSPGAVFTVGVWLLLGWLFRVYVEHFGKNYGETYGAVGGVIVLLFFFYLDALVLLVGAEINSEIDCALKDAACVRDKKSGSARRSEAGP